MNPDLFITLAFITLVVLVALAGALFARSEQRRSKDGDALTAEIGASPQGPTNRRRARFAPNHAQIGQTTGGDR